MFAGYLGMLIRYCPLVPRVLVATGLLFLVSSCGTTPLTTKDAGQATTEAESMQRDAFAYDNTPLDVLLEQARPFVENQRAIPPELAIRIVAASNREQNWQSLKAVVKHTNPSRMNQALFGEYSLQLLKAWAQTGEHNRADYWLNSALFLNHLPLMDVDRQIQLSIARADNHQAMGRFLQSARERIFIEDFIIDEDSQRQNARLIWESLRSVPLLQLQTALEQSSDPSFNAWAELTLAQHAGAIKGDQNPGTTEWLRRWPEHKAEDFLEDELESLRKFAVELPETIAVFLPLSGSMQSMGEAVRDGILAGYFSENKPGNKKDTSRSLQRLSGNGAHTPRLRFYDTNRNSIENLYQQAVNDSAEFIIGPLQKENVKALFTMPTSIPILTLNFVSDELPPPDNVIQFGLAAEDEATRLATLVAGLGYSNPLLLVSDTSWAQRAAERFRDEWEALGKISPRQQNLSVSSNFSGEIAATLGLNSSKSRLQALQNTTMMQFEFVPRRRQDHDAVILFANSDESKNIKPLLAYHYAGDLPVFASSYSYDSDDASANTDLNGIIFSEMPWFLGNPDRTNKNYSESLLLHNTKIRQRLFAMGIDAFELHYRIDQLRSFPSSSWWANTGNLSIEKQRVVRDLPIAKLVSGKLQMYEKRDTLRAQSNAAKSDYQESGT